MTPLLATLAAQTESSLCLCLKTKGKAGSDAVALQQHGHHSPGSSVGARGHAGEEGCGAPDHTLTPARAETCLASLNFTGCGWKKAWLSLEGDGCWQQGNGGWGCASTTSAVGAALQGPTSRDTSSSPASNQHHLPQQPLLPLPPCQQQQNLLLP